MMVGFFSQFQTSVADLDFAGRAAGSKAVSYESEVLGVLGDLSPGPVFALFREAQERFITSG